MSVATQTHQPGPLPVYLPSPAEIEAACTAIQAAWSDEERYARRRGVFGTPSPPKREVIDAAYQRLARRLATRRQRIAKQSA